MGNCLIDQWIRKKSKKFFDKDLNYRDGTGYFGIPSENDDYITPIFDNDEIERLSDKLKLLLSIRTT